MNQNRFNSILVLLTAFVAIFLEGAFNGFRRLFGAQIDLLPALVVYASLCTSLTTLTVLAVGGGLLFDSLSANPLGISVVPLFAVGVAIYSRRELILRDQIFAQTVLGLSASAAVPAMTLVFLLTGGHTPLVSWISVWQWLVMTASGAFATPLLFQLFDFLTGALTYSRVTETSFRPDREIRRGRN